MSDTPAAPENLRSPHQVRILRAVGRMPYGGIVHVPPYPLVGVHRLPAPDLEWVAAYLEALGDVLRGVADRNTAQEAELRALKADLAGARRLLERMFPGLAVLNEATETVASVADPA